MNAALRVAQVALHLWVLGFMLSALPMAASLWVMPLSPKWVPPGPFPLVTHALGTWLPGAMAWPLVGMVLVLALLGAMGRLRWWGALLLWLGYMNLVQRAWMAGSGGQQLMANLLLWNVPLLAGARSGAPDTHVLSQLGWWMMRVQLLLAYALTALHKLGGTLWPAGTAVGVVAGDEAFGPLALLQWPLLAHGLTWGVLGFQLLFPLLIWSRMVRPWLLSFGVLFHLGTALWMDIPEMGMAFIAAYGLWLPEEWAQRLRDTCGRLRGTVFPAPRSGSPPRP